jgi:hypothetical protein
MTKIIISVPDCDSLCVRTCQSCRGGMFVIDKKIWKKFLDIVKKNPCNDTFAGCVVKINDYVKSCKIIRENPSDEIIKLVNEEERYFFSLFKGYIAIQIKKYQE